MALEQLDTHKPKHRLSIQSSTTINSKWSTDPNAETKTIKFLKENIRENLGDMELTNIS